MLVGLEPTDLIALAPIRALPQAESAAFGRVRMPVTGGAAAPGGIGYRVGRYVFSQNEAWLTAYDPKRNVQLWSRRFELHTRVLDERCGALLALVLRDGELRLLEVNPATGESNEVRRLGFAATDLGTNVLVHRNLAYVPGPARIVVVDLIQRTIAWEARVHADALLPLVNAGDEVFGAWMVEGRNGMETTLAKVDPWRGATEERIRMAAHCRGLIANDSALFVRIETGNGVIPFGRHAIAAIAAGGAAEPMLVPARSRWAAGGRYCLLLADKTADLITHDRRFVWTQGRLPAASWGQVQITGDSAYVEGREAFALDLHALSKRAPVAAFDRVSPRSLEPPPTPAPAARALRPEVVPAAVPNSAAPSAVPAPPMAPPARVERDLIRANSWMPSEWSNPARDLTRMPNAFVRALARAGDGRDAWRLSALGLRFLDPRGRWGVRSRRDPSLVDIAQLADGDYVCFYEYPPLGGAELPVVSWSPATERTDYLAPSFEAFLAGYLDEAAESRPGAVKVVVELLSVPPARLGPQVAPEWFRAAHTDAATWELVSEASERGDDIACERLLLALAREAHGLDLESIRSQLRAIYRRLGWASHEDAVRRWNDATASTH